jgi:glycerol-3-phosphate dehydrogenase subunit B
MNEIKKACPHHPYSKLGKEKILSSLAYFQELTHSCGNPYAGTFDSNHLIPTTLGTFHPTCLVPETMRHGDLSLPGKVLLLGFAGLKDFSPLLAAENLNLLHSQGKVAPTFRAAILDKVDMGGKALNNLNLARALDEEDFREKLVRQVKPLLKTGDKLGVPAVLGFHSSFQAWEVLQKKLGTEVFEIPMPPPSVPGLRLYDLVRSHLQQRGVRIIIGLSALKPIAEPGTIRGLYLGEGKKSPFYAAHSFVLATGKFVGGGLDSERGRIYETLFNLPVKYPPHRREWINPQLLTPQGQPFNSLGVEVDENLRPVDARGKVLYDNLYTAGGILAHADSMAEKSGGGVAISTGYWAGKYAAGEGNRPIAPTLLR